MTITATIYNIAGKHIDYTFNYEIDESCIVVSRPLFLDEGFVYGEGWQDDLVEALNQVIEFDFTLKIK